MACDLKPGDVPRAKRRLAAILSADVKGYSQLMGVDEVGTHETLKAHRDVMDGLIVGHGGRVVGTAGDSVLADFPSVVEALSAAVDIQRVLHGKNDALPPERRLEFRIGINLGDVIVDGDDIYGDGVNVAARLQAIGEPGGIAISGGVYDQVKNKLDVSFRDRGAQRVKNIADPVRVYSVEPIDDRLSALKKARKWWLPALATSLLLVAAGIAVLQSTNWSPRDFSWFEAVIAALDQGRKATVSEVASRPTIAVVPFANPSGDPEEEYFSDGVTEDIITALGRFSNLMVMSRNAVFGYAGQPVTPEQLRRDLDVRYVVEGSVRRAGNRVRINLQLTDAERGVVLWSERYDEAVGDIFELQDKIVERVVGTLAVKVTTLEQQRAFDKPTENLDAYDLVLRGRDYLHQATRRGNYRARELFERALEFDPDYVDALVGVGQSYLQDATWGWTEWPMEALKNAREFAHRAVGLDHAAAAAHALLAEIYQWLGQHELAASEIARAIELNPNDAEAYATRGTIMLMTGRPGEAVRSFRAALRSDPNGRPAWFVDLAFSYYLEQQFLASTRTAERCLAQNADFPGCQIALTAALVGAERMEEATEAAKKVRRVSPFLEVDQYADWIADPAQRDAIRAALRKAGLE